MMINPLNSVSFSGLHPYGTGNDGGIARAQAWGRACELARRADELLRDKARQYAHGVINKAEFESFANASIEERMRYLSGRASSLDWWRCRR